MNAGDIMSYRQMCDREGVNLQRGMNYHRGGRISIILMSLLPGAPYADRIEDDGRVLIYEGHDQPQYKGGPAPKTVDQPMTNPSHKLTQNGLFYQAAMRFKREGGRPDTVRVYEKVRPGIWVYNGTFELLDAWQEEDSNRKVFKFRLQMTDSLSGTTGPVTPEEEFDHTPLIPPSVKLEVWRREKGQCVLCKSRDNLHFDHILPWSKGGSSLTAANIRLLCARHNLAKSDRIEYA